MGKGLILVLMSGTERFRRSAVDFGRVSRFSHVVLFHLVFERAVNGRDHDELVVHGFYAQVCVHSNNVGQP